MNKVIRTGQKFNMLTVLYQIFGMGTTKAVCQCDCGEVEKFRCDSVVSGNTKSCGCLHRDNQALIGTRAITTHKLSKHVMFPRWSAMMQRCYNESCESYSDYGAKGVTVCSEWHDVAKFIADMGVPEKDMTLERLDNNLGYSKDNCVWASRARQARNRRYNIRLEYKGETKTLPDWCDDLKIPYSKIFQRLHVLKWSIEKAFETP